jgi:hypothetical protein
MPRKKKELTFQEKMFRIKQAGIPEDVAVSAVDCEWTELETLEERTQRNEIYRQVHKHRYYHPF